MSAQTAASSLIDSSFRVGLIFDSSPLGQACLDALPEVCAVQRWSLSNLRQVAQEDCDLFLLFSDDLPTELPAHIFPRALWAVGSFGEVQRADQYDWVFTSSSATLDTLQHAEIVNSWLIADPEEGVIVDALFQLLQIVSTAPGMPARYYRLVRQEILAAIPTAARRVLDVGCAAGKLGQALKARQSCHVTGVELHPRAAALASAVLDEVIRADIDTVVDDLRDGAYDCIIVADILEHLVDPWRTLRRLASKLEPSFESRLIVSLPNVAHWSVVLSLLSGEWQYANAGILDCTHLRFFTPAAAERLIHASNLVVDEARGVLMVPPPGVQRAKVDLHHGWSESQLSDVYQMVYICRPHLPMV